MLPSHSGNSFSPKQVRNVFIIEDDPIQLQLLKDYLKMKYHVLPHGFSCGEDALQETTLKPDLVLLDYELARDGSNAANGLEILKKIKENDPGVHVVMLSNHDKVDISIACIKHGAFDYIVKGDHALRQLDHVLMNIDTLMNQIVLRKLYKKMFLVAFALLIGIAILNLLAWLSGSISLNL